MALSSAQRDQLERIIKARRTELASELLHDVEKSRRDQYSELTGGSGIDTGDEANADLLSDLDNAELSRDLEELRALDAALKRLVERTYGICGSCGGEIDYDRLKAYPTAVRCFDCQRVHEKTFAYPSKPTL